MKYQNKEQVIQAAKEAGSSAKTFKGAAKFLAKIRPAMPLEKRGVKYRCRPKRRNYEHEKRGDKILAALNLMSYTEAAGYADILSAPLLRKAVSAIKALCNAGHYRRSYSSWAGGVHSVECTLSSEARATGNSLRVWSDNGKWSGTNSYMYISVTWRALLLFPTLILPGTNSIVIYAEPTECNDVMKVTVLEQGRGFDVKPVMKWYVPGKGVFGSQRQAYREAVSQQEAA